MSAIRKPRRPERGRKYSHKITLEEFFQLPLGCRIGKVADVQAATFGGTGKDRIVVGGSGLVSERGIGQSGGNVVDGIGHFLGDSRHVDLETWTVVGDGCVRMISFSVEGDVFGFVSELNSGTIWGRDRVASCPSNLGKRDGGLTSVA